MSDKLKTISDIIAEKRRIAKSIRDDASNGDYWDKQEANEEAEEYEWDADDIEAAYKREMGNIQKMRNALEIVLHFDATDEAAMEDGLTDAERIAEYADHIEECQKKAKAALSAPPRNCDRFNNAVDAMAELKRIHNFCATENRRCLEDCPDCGKEWCSLAWLFATAEESEAAKDEK